MRKYLKCGQSKFVCWEILIADFVARGFDVGIEREIWKDGQRGEGGERERD